MSIFEFADQLGFSPPIVFEDNTVSEDEVFTWPIDFEALGKDLASGTPIPYYYKNYEAGRQSITIKDEVGGDLEIDYESQIPMKIDSPNGGKRSLQLIGKLNKKLGTVAIRQHKVFFDFKLELGKSISFIKKIKYAHQDELAIELTANSYEDYSALSDYIGVGENEKVRNKIINDFNRAFRNASRDKKSLKWLYQRAPRFVINQRGDDQLVKDLKLLTVYDLDSWFVDTSSAVVNVVYGFNDLRVLHDDFQKHSEDVLRIYDALNDSKKEEFTILLTSVAKFISGNSAVSKFIIGKNYIVDSNLSVKDNQDNVYLQQYKYVDGAEVTTSAGGVGFPGGTVSVGTSKVKEIVEQTQSEFNPLDLIMLENEDTKEIRFASALEVKYLSNKTEWEQIMTAVAIIATVIGTLASLGVLGAGVTGVAAVIATVEIAVAIGDLTLVLRKAGLKGTEEGDWFINNWEKISIGTAFISISSAIRQGILRNGPKTLARLRALKGAKVAAIKERIRVLLFNTIINVEIANFGEVAFKVVPFENIRAINGLSIVSKKIKKLWDLNVLILDAVVDGELVYALYYKGQVIVSGAGKQIDDFLKSRIFIHGIKDAEILKVLDDLVDVVKSLVPIKSIDELILFLGKINGNFRAVDLDKTGIRVLFRGTTKVDGKLFPGSLNAQLLGLSTSTDPIRAIIFAIENATLGRDSFFQVILPRDLKGIFLNTPVSRSRYKFELEVVLNTDVKELSNFVVKEIPVIEARELVNKFFNLTLDTKIDRNTSDLLLRELPKTSLEESYNFFESLLKL